MIRWVARARWACLALVLAVLALPVPYARLTEVSIYFTMEHDGVIRETSNLTLWSTREHGMRDVKITLAWLFICAAMLAWAEIERRRRPYPSAWAILRGATLLVTSAVFWLRDFQIFSIDTLEHRVGSLLCDLAAGLLILLSFGAWMAAIGGRRRDAVRRNV